MGDASGSLRGIRESGVQPRPSIDYRQIFFGILHANLQAIEFEIHSADRTVICRQCGSIIGRWSKCCKCGSESPAYLRLVSAVTFMESEMASNICHELRVPTDSYFNAAKQVFSALPHKVQRRVLRGAKKWWISYAPKGESILPLDDLANP